VFAPLFGDRVGGVGFFQRWQSKFQGFECEAGRRSYRMPLGKYFEPVFQVGINSQIQLTILSGSFHAKQSGCWFCACKETLKDVLQSDNCDASCFLMNHSLIVRQQAKARLETAIARVRSIPRVLAFLAERGLDYVCLGVGAANAWRLEFRRLVLQYRMQQRDRARVRFIEADFAGGDVEFAFCDACDRVGVARDRQMFLLGGVK
jgi:hypothetical protein